MWAHHRSFLRPAVPSDRRTVRSKSNFIGTIDRSITIILVRPTRTALGALCPVFRGPLDARRPDDTTLANDSEMRVTGLDRGRKCGSHRARFPLRPNVS